MGLEGEVTEEEWRRIDRRRSLWIYVFGAVAALVLTLVLYFL